MFFEFEEILFLNEWQVAAGSGNMFFRGHGHNTPLYGLY
jgi:hypothetical protein